MDRPVVQTILTSSALLTWIPTSCQQSDTNPELSTLGHNTSESWSFTNSTAVHTTSTIPNVTEATLPVEGLEWKIPVGILVPLTVITAVIATYFLFLKKWLQQRRSKTTDDTEKVKEQGVDPVKRDPLRYSKNPNRKQVAESVTGGYAAIGQEADSGEVQYENLRDIAQRKQDTPVTYENVVSGMRPATKAASKKHQEQHDGAEMTPCPPDSAVPSYRAPVPPPQGGSQGTLHNRDTGSAGNAPPSYVKLVGVAKATQSPTKGHQQHEQGYANVKRGTPPRVALKPGSTVPGSCPPSKLVTLNEAPAEDMYVKPDATKEDETDMYVVPNNEEIYENY